jgi:hypothetical protein
LPAPDFPSRYPAAPSKAVFPLPLVDFRFIVDRGIDLFSELLGDSSLIYKICFTSVCWNTLFLGFKTSPPMTLA